MNSILSMSDRNRRRQAGMSLAEILVAMTIFVVAAAVAMILYNALARSFKLGDNATEVQQNTRIAFENLVTDLRMMGFNYNPDGSARPDEQLEGAWDTAITIRGDFDFEDPTASANPEVALASGGSPYAIVSTGNDEIVTYALAKPGATTGATLTFRADVLGAVRDGATEDVNIANLAVVHDDPPYTLYRITVNANSTNVTRTPVADNIYSMEFFYYDSLGNLVGPATPADISDDIGGEDLQTAISTRAGVRGVGIRLTGMTPDPDLRYNDPTDPIPATRDHRKFTLMQDVSPRNMGYVGRPDMDVLPPSQPTGLTACPGHCQSVFLNWNDPPAEDVISQWSVLRGTSPTQLTTPVTATSTEAFLYGLTEGTSYYFRVRAEDASGNLSPVSALATPSPAAVGDTNTPSAVSSLAVSGGGLIPAQDDVINLSWPAVTTNVQSVTCDPEPNKIRDLKGYRLYRSTAAGNIVTPTFLYQNEDALTPSTTSFEDRNAVACRPYYYDITAVDQCDNASQKLPANQDGVATTQHAPAQVGALQAVPSPGAMDLLWARVAENTNNPPDTILVDTYRVYRLALTSDLSPAQAETASWGTATQVDVTVTDVNAPMWQDLNAVLLSPGMSYYYRVSGLSDCPSPLDEGALSDPVEGVPCGVAGTILLDPADGALVTDVTSVTVDASAVGSQGFVIITDSSAAVVASFGSPLSPQPLPFTFTWDTSALPPGIYTIQATVFDSSGCIGSVTSTVTVVSTAVCCVVPLSPVLGPLTGRISERWQDIGFNLVNLCATDLEMSRQDISWTNVTGNFPQMTDICWDASPGVAPEDCFPTLTFQAPLSPPVSAAFDPPLPFGADRDDLFPLIIGYKFNAALITGTEAIDVGETITVDIFYRPVGGVSDTQCRYTIETNPLTVVIDPGVILP